MKRVKQLFAIKADENYWDDVRGNLLDTSSNHGANVKFRFSGGEEISAHQVILEHSTNFFQRNSDGDEIERDPFGNFVVILPDVDKKTMLKCLEIIYMGETFTSTKGGILNDVLWTMNRVFGLEDEDFTVDLDAVQENGENAVDTSLPGEESSEGSEVDVDEQFLTDEIVVDSTEGDSEISKAMKISDLGRIEESKSVMSDEELPQFYPGQSFRSLDEFQHLLAIYSNSHDIKIFMSKSKCFTGVEPSDDVTIFPFREMTYSCFTSGVQCNHPSPCTFRIILRYRQKKLEVAVCDLEHNLQDITEEAPISTKAFKRPSNIVGCLEENQEFESWEECRGTILNVTESLGMNIIVERTYKSNESGKFPVMKADFGCQVVRGDAAQNLPRTAYLCPFRITVELDKNSSKMKIRKIINLHLCSDSKQCNLELDENTLNCNIGNDVEMKDVQYEGKLVEGYKFGSYRNFLKVFQKYCYEKCIYYKIRDTKRIKNQDVDLSRFPYSKVHFNCRYGGRSRSRSKGLRRTTSVCVECPFSLKICYNQIKECYCLKDVNLDHTGHELAPSYYINLGEKVKKPFNLSEFPKENSKQELGPRALEQLKKLVEEKEDGNKLHEEEDEDVQMMDETQLQRVKAGGVFQSYQEFLEIFKCYCQKTKLQRKIISSTKSHEGICPERFPFSKIHFGCGKSSLRVRRHPSKGPKVTQCPFSVKLVHNKTNHCLVIAEAILIHQGHSTITLNKAKVIHSMKEELKDPLSQTGCADFPDL